MAPPATKSNCFQAMSCRAWIVIQFGAFELVRVRMLGDWFSREPKSSEPMFVVRSAAPSMIRRL